MKDSFTIIKKPILTEKMTILKDLRNQYAFMVDKKANKIEIKRAVEERFGVSVLKVTTLNLRGKLRRLGRFEGRRPSWKKAVVTLREGDSIEFFEGT